MAKRKLSTYINYQKYVIETNPNEFQIEIHYLGKYSVFKFVDLINIDMSLELSALSIKHFFYLDLLKVK